jgi:hypothetical protein
MLALVPVLLLAGRFMLPFMLPLPAFEFDMLEFDMFEFEVFMFDMFEFDVFVFDTLAFDMFELLALLVLALLVFSPPPQAARLATPANARSAKVLRMDRSPELL